MIAEDPPRSVSQNRKAVQKLTFGPQPECSAVRLYEALAAKAAAIAIPKRRPEMSEYVV